MTALDRETAIQTAVRLVVEAAKATGAEMEGDPVSQHSGFDWNRFATILEDLANVRATSSQMEEDHDGLGGDDSDHEGGSPRVS